MEQISNDPPTPTRISRLGPDALEIIWSDGSHIKLESHLLRQKCPCAVCREKRGDGSHDTPLTPTKKKPSLLQVVDKDPSLQTKLGEIWGVGQYAIGLRWEDGHDTGIYTYKYLREISGFSTDKDHS